MNTLTNIAKHPAKVEQLLAKSEELVQLLGFTTEQLYSDCRIQPLSTIRKAIMYLLRQHEFYTLNQIAAIFNKRNHSTVLHACRSGADLAQIKDDRFLHYIKLLSNGVYKQEQETEQVPQCKACSQRAQVS